MGTYKDIVISAAEQKRRVELGRAFEEEVAAAYRQRGYLVTINGAQRGDGRKGDGGIDLFIRRESDPDAPLVAVQCKAWNRQLVDRKEIDEFVNVVRRQHGVQQGILITTSGFTDRALEIGRISGLTLVDGRTLLVELGIDSAALHARFPKIEPAPVAPRVATVPPPRPTVSSAHHVAVASTPMTPRTHRLALVACVLALAGGIGYVVARLTASSSASSSAAQVSVPATAPPPVAPAAKPVVTKPASTPSRVAAARKHVERRAPEAQPPVATLPEPAEPVIYKSADMSDEEFAAWKRRKAEREQGNTAGTDQPPPPDPAYIDGGHVEGVSSQTMQTILRSNRR